MDSEMDSKIPRNNSVHGEMALSMAARPAAPLGPFVQVRWRPCQGRGGGPPMQR